MKLLTVYYRRYVSSPDIGIRIPLPKSIIYTSDDIWCWSLESLNGTLECNRLITFSFQYPHNQVIIGHWKTHKDFYEDLSNRGA